jgi:hypothetical protein
VLLLASINFLIGVILGGAHYRVMILFPLIFAAFLESIVFDLPTRGWITLLRHSAILISFLEIGYFIGAALRVFAPTIRRFFDNIGCNGYH